MRMIEGKRAGRLLLPQPPREVHNPTSKGPARGHEVSWTGGGTYLSTVGPVVVLVDAVGCHKEDAL